MSTSAGATPVCARLSRKRPLWKWASIWGTELDVAQRQVDEYLAVVDLDEEAPEGGHQVVLLVEVFGVGRPQGVV